MKAPPGSCKFVLIAACMLALVLCASCARLRSNRGDAEFEKRDTDIVPHPAETFVLGVGDTVAVRVWRNDDLNRTLRVAPSGDVDFPLVGQIQAAGLTLASFRDALSERLAERYLVNPRVDVTLQSVQSRKLYVLGEVRNPGVIVLDEPLTVYEAIARAGGFTTDASSDRVLLIRRTGTETRADAVRVDGLLGASADAGGVEALRHRDVVYVPPLRIASVARFMNRLNTILNPILSIESGIIMGNDVSNILSGDSTGSSTAVTIPATK